MADEKRQFDFWLGEWEVRDSAGKLAGRNRITRAVGDFGLREEWRGESGLIGSSINAWDAGRRVWHQTWIDSSGTVLLLEGGVRDGSMVLEGTTVDEDEPGGLVYHRITWSLIGENGDRLRQHWETSSDGANWTTLFDGRYARVA
ncbi:MAG TPA: hypothetical protein VG106_14465 [Vicinamibacterales bacterium]|nr:hypothetical protein [Vicinamibacterales bacterium]